MKKAEKIAAKIICGITLEEAYGWPPESWGVFYQAERPAQSCEKAEETVTVKEDSDVE